MKLGIGIDTGGTYTDAVLYDFESKTILAGTKALTTKNDLSVGILGAIDALPADLVRKAETISLSTTLATNACVEDKVGQAKLIFFGGDKKVIDRYGGAYGLPPSGDMYIQESFTRFSGEIEREPDWELFRAQLKERFAHCDGVGIVEMNAMRNGAVVEKKAKQIFQESYKIPVVCGHELFSELNCLQRASSTLLNAGLFPVISDFLAAVKKALSARGIHPEALVIVRSDGSLMSEEFAALRPVETLLCGPAASAVGCTKLTDSPNSIVVDMGGTTTDIALVKNGAPVTVTDGVSIGRWKTFVDGLYVKTFGLGGDSAVHYDEKELFLEPYRVIPLCIAAKEYPSITEDLKKLPLKKHTHFLYEHYVLMKDIGETPGYTDEERALCAALKEKPLSVAEAAQAVGKDIYTLDVKRLIRNGAVQLCGLTPTDVMHIRGDFSGYDREASLLGARFAAHNLGRSVQEVCDLVYDAVKRKLYIHIVEALLENKYAQYMKNGVSREVARFIEENYEAARSGKRDAMLSTMFRTDYSLVGVGAPIGIFLEDVAELLGTRAIIPQYHEVANALGAIVGSVSASCSVQIKPDSGAEGTAGYTVFGNGGNRVFKKLEDAAAFALSEAEQGARAEALRRGAKGNIAVTSSLSAEEAEAKDCTVYLGSVATACAVGTMGF